MGTPILPRFLRYRDAPGYLGMDRNRFDLEVRPHLTEIPIGIQGIGFDRYELDVWADLYIAARGHPGRKRKGEIQCEPGHEASSSPTTARGPSTRSTEASASSSASGRSVRRKPRDDSPRREQQSKPSSGTNFDEALSACGQMAREST